jgi:hypothetical protein
MDWLSGPPDCNSYSKNKKRLVMNNKTALARGSMFAVVFALSPLAQAITFGSGDFQGAFDTQLSIGASWSTQDPSRHLIGANNGGSGAQASVGDDGRLNFRKGETFSKLFKGTHDLDLRYKENTGVFLRGTYWYDFELKDENRRFVDISDHGREEASKSAGAELLDAFVYHNYSIADQSGSARLGKQVVSWGESTFIPGGINSINPVNVAAFRRPGAEIKEALVPVNMFYVAQNLTENLSVEGFYQLDWEQSILDNCGTFFSGSDFGPDGCAPAHLGPDISSYNELANGLIESYFPGQGYALDLDPQGIGVQRVADNKPRDSGQFGLSMRYFSETLGGEIGAYMMNYHSRMPNLSAYASPLINNPIINGLGALSDAVLVGTSTYFMDYPEDIRLYGLSFSTNLSTGTALSGEISYRPNMPIQLNATDMIQLITGNPVISAIYSGEYDQAMPGELVQGYHRKPVTQAQVTAIHMFNQVLGASQLTLVGEVGWTHVANLESALRYGRDPIFGMSETLPNSYCEGGVNNKHCNTNGFVTANSWGYRIRGVLDYPNVFAGVNLKPNIAWSHDVDGYSPVPGGFNEGSKAVSLGLDADYASTYTASLSYTNFFDGTYNTQRDRDFVSLSFGVNF